jgi:hypothetical protein
MEWRKLRTDEAREQKLWRKRSRSRFGRRKRRTEEGKKEGYCPACGSRGR